MRFQPCFTILTPLLICALVSAGGVSANHGLDDLIERVGIENTPTGAGVEVGQVEASAEGGEYAPDVDEKQFIGKTFLFHSGPSGVSNHATQVGKRIYGIRNVGLAPGVDLIDLYSASGWATTDYLHVGTGSNPSPPPGNLALFNNSWIASFGSNSTDNQALRRADWSIDNHDVVMLNGVANSGDHLPLMSFGFNCISVGKENGEHVSDPVPSGFDLPGRQIPLIVASQNTTSNATGVVSAATALLIETAETHPNTSGNFFASLSETTKAVLLTGGMHFAGWTNNPATSGANRGRTSQPIDAVVGVGTVNIDRAHRVMTGGQHASGTSPTGLIPAPEAAWETATLSSNQNRYIKIEVPSLADEVSVVLTWHQKANGGFGSYTIVDFDLELLQFQNGKLVSLVGNSGLGVFGSGNVVSESSLDNVEHLYIQDLSPGEYVLKIHRVDSTSGSNVFSVGWLFPEADGVLGDITGDGIIDVSDILALIGSWGSCSGDCQADLNGDGVVGVSDLLLLLSYW
jgi:hypothetical protein